MLETMKENLGKEKPRNQGILPTSLQCTGEIIEFFLSMHLQ